MFQHAQQWLQDIDATKLYADKSSVIIGQNSYLDLVVIYKILISNLGSRYKFWYNLKHY